MDLHLCEAPDKAEPSWMALLRGHGLKRLTLFPSFLFLLPPSFHLPSLHLLVFFLFFFFRPTVRRVLFSHQCHLPPGRPESLHLEARCPALAGRKWWGIFALIMLINSSEAVDQGAGNLSGQGGDRFCENYISFYADTQFNDIGNCHPHSRRYEFGMSIPAWGHSNMMPTFNMWIAEIRLLTLDDKLHYKKKAKRLCNAISYWQALNN